jgi:hypothetical protein
VTEKFTLESFENAEEPDSLSSGMQNRLRADT